MGSLKFVSDPIIPRLKYAASRNRGIWDQLRDPYGTRLHESFTLIQIPKSSRLEFCRTNPNKPIRFRVDFLENFSYRQRLALQPVFFGIGDYDLFRCGHRSIIRPPT